MSEEVVAPPQTQTDNRPPPPPSSPSTSSHPQAMENQDHHYHSPQSASGEILPIIASDAAVSATPQNQEQNIDRGQGLYAVQYASHMGMSPDYSSTILIPLKYKIPIRSNTTGEENGQGGEAVRRPNGAGQRQVVVRRFHVAFQLDLALLLKLAFAVVLFSQEGSRQRTIVLILLATLVYLYQTGVLTPLVRYARRALTPPQPFAARQQNPAVRQNAANDQQQQPAENNAGGAENEIDPVIQGNQPDVAAAAAAERGNNEGMNLVGIAREIQTFVVGFIASLLPGFEHPHND